MITDLLVAMSILSATVAAQTIGKDGTEQAGMTLPDEYLKVCKGDGKLAVFGRLIDQKTGKGKEGAMVTLQRNYGGATTSYTKDEGRYCIKYPPGPDITALWFAADGSSCVEDISGNESHYINKLFDNGCSPFGSHASLLSPDETKMVFGSRVARMMVAIQVVLRNTSGQSLQLLDVSFEPTGDSQKEFETQAQLAERSRRGIAPVDSRIVAELASSKRLISLFRIGPVAVFSFGQSQSNPESLVYQTAFSPREIIPPDTSEVKIVFIPRSYFPADAFSTPMAIHKTTASLGNLVVVANRLTSNGEVRSSGSLMGETIRDGVLQAQGELSATASIIVPVK